MLPSSFHKFLVHNFQELDATDVQHTSLCWDCSQRLLQGPQSRCGKSSPTVHWSHQSRCQTVQLRKWIDSSFAHFVCVNKTVKLRQNNNRNKTKQKLQQQCFAASVYQTHMGLSCWALYRLKLGAPAPTSETIILALETKQFECLGTVSLLLTVYLQCVPLINNL